MKLNVLVPLLLGVILVGCDKDDDFAIGEFVLAENAPSDGPVQIVPDDAPPADPQEEEAAPNVPDAYGPAVDHPYFPMTPGRFWIFEGESDGEPRRDEVRVLDETELIAGVACTALQQEVYIDGDLVEVTTEWYAQDVAGNLWKFGEESHELEDGSHDIWLAGTDGATAWQVLPFEPAVGDRYVENVADGGDELRVMSMTLIATVPAGVFADCLQAVENPDDPNDTDIVIYAPGVGLVSEQSAEGTIELTATGP